MEKSRIPFGELSGIASSSEIASALVSAGVLFFLTGQAAEKFTGNDLVEFDSVVREPSSIAAPRSFVTTSDCPFHFSGG